MLTSSLQQNLSDITSNFAAQAEELRDARNALSGEKKRFVNICKHFPTALAKRVLRANFVIARIDPVYALAVSTRDSILPHHISCIRRI